MGKPVYVLKRLAEDGERRRRLNESLASKLTKLEAELPEAVDDGVRLRLRQVAQALEASAAPLKIPRPPKKTKPTDQTTDQKEATP